MKARDVMVSPVITVIRSASVKEVAKLLIEKGISGVPVVGGDGRMVGMISEGDLLHRSESGTERRRPWWLSALVANETLADEYVRSHAHKVEDIMTRRVITALPDTPLHVIATLLERNSIKRVPIVDNDRLVGIVSRANLIQAIACNGKELKIPLSDAAIREKLLAHLGGQPWAHTSLINVTVNSGVVDLWGYVDTSLEKKAIRVAAEEMPGVAAVNDNLVARPMGGWF